MPFTVSHVAAVLPAGRFPLLQAPLIMSAFVIGAMSPDVPHYTPMFNWWAESHSWSGLILVDIPLTLLAVAVYWAVLAAPLSALAPRGIRARLPRHVLRQHRAAPLRTAVLLVLAAGAGTATHLIWDSFTHAGQAGVIAVPLLQSSNVIGPMPAYRVLQYLSSVAGLALIAWTLLRWYRRTPPSRVVAPGLGWHWRAAFSASVVAAGVLAWWSVRDLVAGADTYYGLRALLYGGVTRSVAFMALVVVVGALVAQPALARAEATADSR